MYCPQCSTKLDDDLAFCTNCGRSMDEVETVVLPKAGKPSRDTSITTKVLFLITGAAVAIAIAAFLFNRPTDLVKPIAANEPQNPITQSTIQAAAPQNDPADKIANTLPPPNATPSMNVDVAQQENSNKEERERIRRRNEANAAKMATKQVSNAYFENNGISTNSIPAANAALLNEMYEESRRAAKRRGGCYTAPGGTSYRTDDGRDGWIAAFQPVSIISREGRMYRVALRGSVALIPVNRVVCN